MPGMQIKTHQVEGLDASLTGLADEIAGFESGPPLATVDPANDLWTPVAGASGEAARADHQHMFPLAVPKFVTTATYTLDAVDHGRVVAWNGPSSGGNVILPYDMPEGFNCILRVVTAAGTPTFTTSGTGSIRQADGLTKPRKQWSEVSISVHANEDWVSAEWVLSGDMA